MFTLNVRCFKRKTCPSHVLRNLWFLYALNHSFITLQTTLVTDEFCKNPFNLMRRNYFFILLDKLIDILYGQFQSFNLPYCISVPFAILPPLFIIVYAQQLIIFNYTQTLQFNSNNQLVIFHYWIIILCTEVLIK